MFFGVAESEHFEGVWGIAIMNMWLNNRKHLGGDAQLTHTSCRLDFLSFIPIIMPLILRFISPLAYVFYQPTECFSTQRLAWKVTPHCVFWQFSVGRIVKGSPFNRRVDWFLLYQFPLPVTIFLRIVTLLISVPNMGILDYITILSCREFYLLQ